MARTEGEEQEIVVKFLHISDIHFDEELSWSEHQRKQVINQMEADAKEVDYIIISGDLFNRGGLNANNKGKIDVIRELSKKCGAKVIITPGNHDLDRFARVEDPNGFNSFSTRKDIVVKKADEAIQGEFSFSNSEEKQILYGGAFGNFWRCVREEHISDQQIEKDLDYEIQIKTFPIGGTEYRIRFVLLNTALLAGQSVCGDRYKSEQRKLQKERDRTDDPVKKAEILVKMEKLRSRFIKDGELIIDEEKPTDDESGRMSLSREGNQVLLNIESLDRTVTIFVGHHGYDYLTKRTQDALVTAMERCRSGIYLCGHAHQSGFRPHNIHLQTVDFPRYVEQYQVGAMYSDATGYASFGYNFGTFSITVKDGRVTGKIKECYYRPDPFGKYSWRSKCIDCRDVGITLPEEKDQEASRPDDTKNMFDSLEKVDTEKKMGLMQPEEEGQETTRLNETKKGANPLKNVGPGNIKRNNELPADSGGSAEKPQGGSTQENRATKLAVTRRPKYRSSGNTKVKKG